MGSFKLKLVAWFALLALLPLAVAFSGYDTLAKRSETRRADATLEGGLRAVVAGYRARLDLADAAAARLAADPALKEAIRRNDRAQARRIVARTPGATISFRNGAKVHVAPRIDDALLRSIAVPGLQAVAARGGRVVAGPGTGGPLVLEPGTPGRVRLGSHVYRGLETAPVDGLRLAVVVPQHGIDAAARNAEKRLLGALVFSLLVFALAAYLLGRSVVATLRRLAAAAHSLADGRLDERVEVRGNDEFAQVGAAFNRMAEQLEQRLAELELERNRTREATARFGEAMAATLDPAQLVRIVVESAVEATGAVGGVVLGPHGELARAGDPDGAAERIAYPLRVGKSDFGSLVLVSHALEPQQVEAAAGLAAQVVVALENARLHRIVERQAMVDSLTGLANRRSLEETLRSELARAARFGDTVSLVMADLDEFKQVNDVHGHAKGDEVLQAFARTLRETVRESDVAGRWGGEEFALVLTGTDAAGGARLAERARAAIAAHDFGEVGSVTASFGVASYPEAHELGELLAAADSALYEAKRTGRNRVVVSPESIRS